MSFDGDLYPEAGASKVITTKGDLVRGNASGDRERYGIGSTNQILSVSSGNILWKTLTTADSVLTTQGDILYEGAGGLARLGQSTDGFVLTTKGASANPVWAAAGGGQVELLDTHTATGTESTYEYTGTLDLDADYQEIISYFNGKTSDSLILQNKINSGTEYHTRLTSNLNGTVSGISNDSATQIDLIGTGINNVARNCQALIHITKAQVGGTSSPICYYGWANSAARACQNFAGGTANTGSDDITSIEWLTSTSTWTAETTIQTFGLKK